MSRQHQFAEVTQEQRTNQRCNMQTIGIRIGQDANLVITKIADVGIRRVDAQSNGDVVYFL